MANYRETFPNKHAVLPVIHVQNEVQVLKNLDTAMEEGADGVFLIDMQWSWRARNHLMQLQRVARNHSPNFFIGINDLSISAVGVFDTLNSGVSGVWIDNAGIVADDASEQREAWDINWKRQDSGWDGLYFGGVAFKYQDFIGNDVALAARIAARFMEVVTTSGDGTGIAPDVNKIIEMKSAIGDHPLAIASGISPENVNEYTPHADAFLVATSLLAGKTDFFDNLRVRALVEAVRGK